MGTSIVETNISAQAQQLLNSMALVEQTINRGLSNLISNYPTLHFALTEMNGKYTVTMIGNEKDELAKEAIKQKRTS